MVVGSAGWHGSLLMIVAAAVMRVVHVWGGVGWGVTSVHWHTQQLCLAAAVEAQHHISNSAGTAAIWHVVSIPAAATYDTAVPWALCQLSSWPILNKHKQAQLYFLLCM
jgi:hypothetical protein